MRCAPVRGEVSLAGLFIADIETLGRGSGLEPHHFADQVIECVVDVLDRHGVGGGCNDRDLADLREKGQRTDKLQHLETAGQRQSVCGGMRRVCSACKYDRPPPNAPPRAQHQGTASQLGHGQAGVESSWSRVGRAGQAAVERGSSGNLRWSSTRWSPWARSWRSHSVASCKGLSGAPDTASHHQRRKMLRKCLSTTSTCPDHRALHSLRSPPAFRFPRQTARPSLPPRRPGSPPSPRKYLSAPGSHRAPGIWPGRQTQSDPRRATTHGSRQPLLAVALLFGRSCSGTRR